MQVIKPSSIKDFQTLNKLGEGAFGVVYRVKRKQDGLQYAMKKVKLVAMKQKQRENAVNQIRILASLKCDYIIGYKDAFYDEPTSNLCVVMEYATNGDLLKKISNHSKSRTKFPQQQIWRAMVHMAKGLKSLHDIKILHRDLKCANVFISSDSIYKLGDLNVSKVLKREMAYTQTGTPYYASPQVWQDLPYDAKSDIWSLGCVIYQMAALRPPFQATDLTGLSRKVRQGKYDKISGYSTDLSVVLSMLLKVNPKLRPSTDELLNNSIVQKNYKDQNLLINNNEQQKQSLLQTIKFNQYNLKALKDKLPKSNYQQKKQEKKLEPVIEKKQERVPLKIQTKNQIKIENKPSSVEIKNRDRVLSAGGNRPSYCQSPKIVTHRKDQVKKVQEPYKKMMQLNNPRLPPKPQQQSQQQPGQYKLPPKPQQNQLQQIVQTPKNNNINIQNNQYNYHSNNNNNNISNQRKSSQQKRSINQVPQKLYQDYLNSKNRNERPSSRQNNNNSRQNSRENIKNIGSANKLPRSNSAQRIQPSWWG